MKLWEFKTLIADSEHHTVLKWIQQRILPLASDMNTFYYQRQLKLQKRSVIGIKWSLTDCLTSTVLFMFLSFHCESASSLGFYLLIISCFLWLCASSWSFKIRQECWVCVRSAVRVIWLLTTQPSRYMLACLSCMLHWVSSVSPDMRIRGRRTNSW